METWFDALLPFFMQQHNMFLIQRQPKVHRIEKVLLEIPCIRKCQMTMDNDRPTHWESIIKMTLRQCRNSVVTDSYCKNNWMPHRLTPDSRWPMNGILDILWDQSNKNFREWSHVLFPQCHTNGQEMTTEIERQIRIVSVCAWEKYKAMLNC